MQSSNPFENSGSSGGGEGSEDTKDDFVLLKKDEDPTIQSTLIKRLDSIQQQDHLKKKQDLDTKSNESSSICGASPFEVSKEDHSNLKSANDLKQKENQKLKQQQQQEQQQEQEQFGQQSTNETISLPFSNNNESIVNLNNQQQQSTEIINNNKNNNNNNNDQFVSVPFSPPLKPFSLEKIESNSELPFIRPDNYESTNYPHNTTTNSNSGILNPGIDRAYYNMNSRIGSNIPLDDDNANPFARITTAVDPEVEVNNDDDEAGPMVNININPGTFAEPNGAEVPVVTRRRRTDDKIGVIIMCTIIIIIIGGCIAFLFI